jgi:hypothetical protein
LEVVDEVCDDTVHVRFHGENAGDGVVPDDGAFEAGVFGVVGFAEHVVCDFAVDDRAAVFEEVALVDVNISRGDREVLRSPTLVHFPSVL